MQGLRRAAMNGEEIVSQKIENMRVKGAKQRKRKREIDGK
jgi:hypothetical protein